MDAPVLGIDLGTTFSVVACGADHASPRVLPNAEGSSTTPSVVCVRADGSLLVGAEAVAEMAWAADSTARFFKRDMGTEAAYDLGGHRLNPVDLSAAVLRKVKRDAETAVGACLREAVVTVPAYFQNGPRAATLAAAQMAGLDVLQMINEPTAAALAYGAGREGEPETYLVYDLGGGTFDVSLVRASRESIDVVATDGNHSLGGKDWDDRLALLLLDKMRSQHRYDLTEDPADLQEWAVKAEQAKIALSTRASAVVTFSAGGRRLAVDVTRGEFEGVTADLVQQTESLVLAVLREAAVAIDGVGGILMVGGSSRMPMCADLVRRLTGKAPRSGIHPDECVAMGAALHAMALRKPTRPSPSHAALRKIRDVTGHSLGMVALSQEGDRYVNCVLIPKNSPVPCEFPRAFKAHRASESVAVYVTQGESDEVSDCSLVGKYVIRGLAQGGQPECILEMTYQYDTSGMVTVAARERGEQGALRVTREELPSDFNWLDMRPAPRVPPQQVYIAVDLSGSMAGSPLRAAKKAIRGFLDQTDLAHTSVGLIRFADKLEVTTPAGQDRRALEDGLRAWRIGAVGYANSAHPFDRARELLVREEMGRFLIVLTDGIWSCQKAARESAQACRDSRIHVIAIGFGSVDERFLKDISSSDDFSVLTTECGLGQAFESIAQVILDPGTSGLAFSRRGNNS